MATQRQLAKYLDTSEHTVRDLVKAGVFLKTEKRANYDLDVCRVAYINYLRSLVKGKDSVPDPDAEERATERLKTQDNLQTEKARLAAEQANKAALDNAIRRREVAPVSALRDYAAQVGNHVRANLEALPAMLSRRIPHLRATEVNLVKQEVTKISDAIADFEPDHQGAA